jgi:hypothetical protein
MRVSSPNVLAVWNWIEDLVPTAAGIEVRHAQRQHSIMPTPVGAKPSSRAVDLGGCEICYLHFFLSATRNKQAQDAQQHPEERAKESKPERKTAGMFHHCISRLLFRSLH